MNPELLFIAKLWGGLAGLMLALVLATWLFFRISMRAPYSSRATMLTVVCLIVAIAAFYKGTLGLSIDDQWAVFRTMGAVVVLLGYVVIRVIVPPKETGREDC